MSGLAIFVMISMLWDADRRPAPQASHAPRPAACQPAPDGQINHEACVVAAPAGTPWHSLSAINLGTQAYMRGDAVAALRWYDDAEIPGNAMTSDAVFHTFRADARRQGGRDAQALEDARLAWRLIEDPSTYPPGVEPVALDDNARAQLLTLLLPILFKGGDIEATARAKAAYVAIPLDDPGLLGSRGAVLEILGDLPAALASSERAAALAPDDALVLNNHCYVLARSGRPDEAIGFCQQAVERLGPLPPDAQAAIRHSYATALAKAGRCDEAEAEVEAALMLQPASELYAASLSCAALAH